MGRKGVSHEPIETLVTVPEGDQEEKIRSLAFQLFCKSGYQQGHDQEHWLEAERLVLGKPEKK